MCEIAVQPNLGCYDSLFFRCSRFRRFDTLGYISQAVFGVCGQSLP